jgi:K+-transporting ATPase ATPase C chain
MKYLMPAIRFKLFMTLLLGLIYPFAMTGLAQSLFHEKANGEFVTRDGHVIGAKLIAQKFESAKYFWPRPSAVDFNPLPSGGSNLGQASQDLKKAYDDRRTKLMAAHPMQSEEPPQELLFASGSGLDPHISPQAALYQMKRVAAARGLSEEKVITLIDAATEHPKFGFLGESIVNVLDLNLALDKTAAL